jgi:hypothetical protein
MSGTPENPIVIEEDDDLIIVESPNDWYRANTSEFRRSSTLGEEAPVMNYHPRFLVMRFIMVEIVVEPSSMFLLFWIMYFGYVLHVSV